MQENLINGAARPDALRALDKARIAKTWQQYYEDRGYELWGFSPSPTARILAQTILDSNPRRSERIEIVDWGCGYGRDSFYFLELGFDVIGIDVSEKAVALARRAYKQRQANGIPLLGSASFHAGDLHSVFKSRRGQRVHAFFSNRVLHLLGQIDFCEATRKAMTCMEKGAYFCVSARGSDDFNTALMEWIPGKEQEMARYKDPARGGHDITFVTKDRLLRAVENDLEDMHCTNATEPERVGSPDTHLLILLGRKRGWVSDAAMPTVGSNLAAETADGDGVETSRNCSKDAHLGLKSTRDASSALELSQFEHRRTSRSTGGRMSALERPDPTGMASLPARSDRAGLTASSLPQSPILSTLGAADGGQSLDAGADRVNAGAPHA